MDKAGGPGQVSQGPPLNPGLTLSQQGPSWPTTAQKRSWPDLSLFHCQQLQLAMMELVLQQQ